MSCVFCAIARNDAPAEIVHLDSQTMAIVPLNPVVAGHILVLPREHVADFTVRPSVTAAVMHTAAELAANIGPCNLITSKGAEATQTVFHLHVHIVPRAAGDNLALPWTGRKGEAR